MPANIVKTPEDEKHWEEAKAAVRKQYPDVDEGSDRFYKLVMSVFRRMKHHTGARKPPPAASSKSAAAMFRRALRKAKYRRKWRDPKTGRWRYEYPRPGGGRRVMSAGTHRRPKGSPRGASVGDFAAFLMAYENPQPEQLDDMAAEFLRQHGVPNPPPELIDQWAEIGEDMLAGEYMAEHPAEFFGPGGGPKHPQSFGAAVQRRRSRKAGLLADLHKAAGHVVSPPAKDKPLPTGAHRTPPKGYPKRRAQYAIPEEFKYPLSTKKKVKAALSYFSQHKGQYSPEEQKRIWRRIVRAAKRLGVDVSAEVRKRAKARLLADLRKAQYGHKYLRREPDPKRPGKYRYFYADKRGRERSVTVPGERRGGGTGPGAAQAQGQGRFSWGDFQATSTKYPWVSLSEREKRMFARKYLRERGIDEGGGFLEKVVALLGAMFEFHGAHNMPSVQRQGMALEDSAKAGLLSDLHKAGRVKHPGIRGGRFYYTRTGRVRYGQQAPSRGKPSKARKRAAPGPAAGPPRPEPAGSGKRKAKRRGAAVPARPAREVVAEIVAEKERRAARRGRGEFNLEDFMEASAQQLWSGRKGEFRAFATAYLKERGIAPEEGLIEDIVALLEDAHGRTARRKRPRAKSMPREKPEFPHYVGWDGQEHAEY